MKASFRKHFVIALLIALCTAQVIIAETETGFKKGDSNTDIEGVWEGTLNAQGVEMRLVLHIVSKGEGTFKGLMDSPDQGFTDIQVDDIKLNDNKLSFNVNSVGGKYKGTLDDAGETIDGKWSQGAVYALVLKKDPSRKPKELKERTAVEVDAAVLELYTGEYQIQPGFILTVTTRDNRLFVQATGQPELEVFPESETKFFYSVVNAQITFVKDENGTVSKLVLHQGGRNMNAPKLDE